MLVILVKPVSCSKKCVRYIGTEPARRAFFLFVLFVSVAHGRSTHEPFDTTASGYGGGRSNVFLQLQITHAQLAALVFSQFAFCGSKSNSTSAWKGPCVKNKHRCELADLKSTAQVSHCSFKSLLDGGASTSLSAS